MNKAKRTSNAKRNPLSPYAPGAESPRRTGQTKGASKNVALVFDELKATPLWAVQIVEKYLSAMLADPHGTAGPTEYERLQAARAVIVAGAVRDKRIEDARGA